MRGAGRRPPQGAKALVGSQRGRRHGCPVITPEYTAPELHREGLSRARRTSASDAFALAVLLYQLLMGGSHPFEQEFGVLACRRQEIRSAERSTGFARTERRRTSSI